MPEPRAPAAGTAAGLLLLAFLGWLFFAMTTYSLDDSGWSYQGFDDTPQGNWGGQFGAEAADRLFSFLGHGAWVLFLTPLLWGVRLARRRPVLRGSWAQVLPTVLLSNAVLLLCCAGLFSFYGESAQLPQGAGGIFGRVIAELLYTRIGVFPASLLLLCISAICLHGAVEFDLLRFVDLVGQLTLEGLYLAGLGLLWLGRQPPRLARRLLAPVRARIARRREERQIRAQVRARHMGSKPAADKPPAPAAPPRPKPTGPGKGGASPAAGAKQRPAPEADPARAAQRPAAVPSAADLLIQPEGFDASANLRSRQDMARAIEENLATFGVQVKVAGSVSGPVVTRFEVDLAPGLKVSRISQLAKDLARSLAVAAVRVVEVIPGKSLIGIEVPNPDRRVVRLSEVASSPAFGDPKLRLPVVLGHGVDGEPVVADLTRMPHLLMAGTTGSGKSVGVNAMLMSLLLRHPPETLNLVLIDPKMLELSVYEEVPHLVESVVTDMEQAANALRWCVSEMEARYRLMTRLGVRNLEGYNQRVGGGRVGGGRVAEGRAAGEAGEADTEGLQALPYIVVVVDELADMMMTVGRKVEELIARIAQKARAAGIHLVVATQRPSVDVITGLIKANIPSRIAYQVSSNRDSRIILDQGGAEQLLGHGDMLFLPSGSGIPQRVHGALVEDSEVHEMARRWAAAEQGRPPREHATALELLREAPGEGQEGAEAAAAPAADPAQAPQDGGAWTGEGGDDEEAAYYQQAVQFVLRSRRASISSVQRQLRIGYNRAARIVERMEEEGLVSPVDAQGKREVLARPGGADEGASEG